MGVEVDAGAHALQEDFCAVDFAFAVGFVEGVVAAGEQWVFDGVLDAGKGGEEVGADFDVVLQVADPFDAGVGEPVGEADVEGGGEAAVCGEVEEADAEVCGDAGVVGGVFGGGAVVYYQDGGFEERDALQGVLETVGAVEGGHEDDRGGAGELGVVPPGGGVEGVGVQDFVAEVFDMLPAARFGGGRCVECVDDEDFVSKKGDGFTKEEVANFPADLVERALVDDEGIERADVHMPGDAVGVGAGVYLVEFVRGEEGGAFIEMRGEKVGGGFPVFVVVGKIHCESCCLAAIFRELPKQQKFVSVKTRGKKAFSHRMPESKPSIVFLSPVIPAFSGNGLAMRAGRNLQALAGEFTVHLLVVAMYGGQEGEPAEEVLRYCASWRRILAPVPAAKSRGWSLFNFLKWGQGRLPAEWSGWTARKEREAAVYFAETRCERLWVFRFYLLPWARAWMDGGGEAWLDIDEMESGARESQAGLLSLAGEEAAAARLRGDAGLYRALEERHLGRFGRIVTASELEAERVAARTQGKAVVTWPNVVAIPDGIAGAARSSDDAAWRLLFVGSLGHFPNREAIHFAAREVLPRLQALIPRPVVLCVAGAGADAHREAFRGLPHVEWLGTVADLAPTYAMADVVLVPLRAGGGTRIKILEAFAHGKPVVSTHTGAEGLRGLEHGRELLLADDPAEIAAACAGLFHNAKKQEALVANGRACVAARYSPANLRLLATTLRGEMDAERAGSRGRE